MSEVPFSSVIIPTYNRGHLLARTLASFQEQSYPADRFEILVADNNSQDDTRERVAAIARVSRIPIHYLFEPRQGVHFARNSAAKSAQGTILYFTDDDMEADRALLGELVKVFDLDPRVGCATGTILPRFSQPPPRWVERTMLNGLLSLTEADQPEELVVSRRAFAYSCHQAVQRDAFFRSGGFNPENTAGVWIGDGETGLNAKLRGLGYLFAFTAKSITYHVIPPERTTLGYLVRRLGNQGFCDSYSEYRLHRNRAKLVGRMVRRNAVEVPKALARSLLRLAQRRESWRHLPAWASYFARRNQYDLRLLTDSRFRRVVEIDDWIRDDDIATDWLAEVLGAGARKSAARGANQPTYL